MVPPTMKSVDPESINDFFIIPATGKQFVDGIAMSYDENISKELLNKTTLSIEDYQLIMRKINDAILLHWPCDVCYVSKVVCKPLSLIGRLLCGWLGDECCAHDVEIRLKQEIKLINNMDLMKSKGLEIIFKKRLCKSWLELHY